MAQNQDISRESSEMRTTDDNYRSIAINPPSYWRVEALAKDLNFELQPSQIEEITGVVAGLLEAYEEVYRMPEPKPPVKYPRTPGYRPEPEEDPHNAWYMKTDIMGAEAGILKGKKIAIKDNIAVAGVPMMNGSKLIEGYVPDYDATVVTRVLDAGGRIMGKSACEHFCLSGNSFTNDIGPCLHPLDKSRSPGGSSSGNAVLVTLGDVDMAIGGDQGGSIRIPASWCGLVGLKPTYGLVPFTGAIPIEFTLDHLGPMARNVMDCAIMLEVLAGYDGMDQRQPETFPQVPEYSKLLKSNLEGMKLGVVKEGFQICDPNVADVVMDAAKNLRNTGAVVEEVSIPMHSSGQSIWTTVDIDGAYETMVVRGGYGPSKKGFHDTNFMTHVSKSIKTCANDLSIPMKVFGILGKYLQETNNYSYYCRGANLVRKLTETYDVMLMQYDALIMPTLPYTAPKLPSKDATIKDIMREGLGMVRNTSPFNATGHPALSINAGFINDLPVGMMIIGKKWHDQDILKVAFAHERLQES